MMGWEGVGGCRLGDWEMMILGVYGAQVKIILCPRGIFDGMGGCISRGIDEQPHEPHHQTNIAYSTFYSLSEILFLFFVYKPLLLLFFFSQPSSTFVEQPSLSILRAKDFLVSSTRSSFIINHRVCQASSRLLCLCASILRVQFLHVSIRQFYRTP